MSQNNSTSTRSKTIWSQTQTFGPLLSPIPFPLDQNKTTGSDHLIGPTVKDTKYSQSTQQVSQNTSELAFRLLHKSWLILSFRYSPVNRKTWPVSLITVVLEYIFLRIQFQRSVLVEIRVRFAYYCFFRVFFQFMLDTSFESSCSLISGVSR